MLETLNLWAAWVGILLGMFSGAAQGLFFHRADWLDGYGSWARRLIRLGQISLFGLASSIALTATSRCRSFPNSASMVR